jgi:peptide chain release factor 2
VTHFDLPGKQAIIDQVQNEMANDNFWNDRRGAQARINTMNQMKEIVEGYENMLSTFSQLYDTVEMLKQEFDEELSALVEMEYEEQLDNFEKFEIKILLSHDYDKNNAIIELHPGAGGTESQDWALMLYRMYTRWRIRRAIKYQY